MNRSEIASAIEAMRKQNGFYIATDTSAPGHVTPLAVIGGKIYSMKIDSELDPERFFKTARLSGPYPATPPT